MKKILLLCLVTSMSIFAADPIDGPCQGRYMAEKNIDHGVFCAPTYLQALAMVEAHRAILEGQNRSVVYAEVLVEDLDPTETCLEVRFFICVKTVADIGIGKRAISSHITLAIDGLEKYGWEIESLRISPKGTARLRIRNKEGFSFALSLSEQGKLLQISPTSP